MFGCEGAGCCAAAGMVATCCCCFAGFGCCCAAVAAAANPACRSVPFGCCCCCCCCFGGDNRGLTLSSRSPERLTLEGLSAPEPSSPDSTAESLSLSLSAMLYCSARRLLSSFERKCPNKGWRACCLGGRPAAPAWRLLFTHHPFATTHAGERREHAARAACATGSSFCCAGLVVLSPSHPSQSVRVGLLTVTGPGGPAAAAAAAGEGAGA